MNVLYDKDHYKLALGQLNIARHKVDEFVLRLLLFLFFFGQFVSLVPFMQSQFSSLTVGLCSITIAINCNIVATILIDQ